MSVYVSIIDNHVLLRKNHALRYISKVLNCPLFGTTGQIHPAFMEAVVSGIICC